MHDRTMIFGFSESGEQRTYLIRIKPELAEELLRRVRVETEGDEPGIQHDREIAKLVAAMRKVLDLADGQLPPGYSVERYAEHDPNAPEPRWVAMRGNTRLTVFPTTQEKARFDAWSDYECDTGEEPILEG